MNNISSHFDEEEVLRLLQNPSTHKKGFEMIVSAYSSTLYWQIRRMVIFHDDANDVLQETWINVWKNIDYFRGESKISTWLYRIATNQCLTFLNKQKAMAQVSMDSADASIVSKLESDPYFSGDKAQLLLQKALVTLPEKQRLVFNFRYYDEMSYTEMSEFMGVSVGALKADYHHAVKKIAKFFEDEE